MGTFSCLPESLLFSIVIEPLIFGYMNIAIEIGDYNSQLFLAARGSHLTEFRPESSMQEGHESTSGNCPSQTA